MAPLQIILLLLLVRLPRSLALADGATVGAVPAYLRPMAALRFPPGWVLATFYLSHALLCCLVFWRTRAALKILNHPSASSVAVAARTESLFQNARWATMVVTGVPLFLLGLPFIVTGALAQSSILARVPMLPEAIYIAPALLTWIAIWIAAWQVECANRERSFPYRLAAGLPAHGMPPLPHYLSMHIRHNFYIIVPIAAATLIEEIARRLDPIMPHASEVGFVLAFACLVLMMPWFITHAWNTVALTGPLRTRLDAMARRYRLRFRNILVWKTHNAITNAAILGYLPFSRYFLMTDALLETLTDRQLEAVFAHEVGHGVHRHIWWYMIFLLTALLLATGLADLCVPQLHFLTAHFGAGSDNALGVIASLLLMALFITLGFPLVSHRFEHQADWFAARHMASEQRLHPDSLPIPARALVPPEEPTLSISEPGQDIVIPGPALSYSHEKVYGTPEKSEPPADAGGAESFISALDTIADLAHRSRNKKGWMHPSINDRINLLRTLAASARAEKAFRRRMIRARLCLVALLVLAGGITFYTSTHLPKEPPPALHRTR